LSNIITLEEERYSVHYTEKFLLDKKHPDGPVDSTSPVGPVQWV
jgi:hypothetical protein